MRALEGQVALSLRPGHFVSGPAIPFGSPGAEQKVKRLIMYPANMEGGDEVSGHFFYRLCAVKVVSCL